MADLSRAHIIKVLLSPSWYEAVVLIVVSLALTVAAIVPLLYQQGGYASTFNLSDTENTEIYQSISGVGEAVNSSDAASTVAVFMFWAFVGLVVFFAIDAALRWAAAFSSFMESVRLARTSHAHFEAEGLQRFGIRVAAAAGLYLLYLAVFTWLLPLVLLLAHRSLDAGRLQAVLNIVGITLLVAMTIHVAVILVRLLLLRVRVFSSPLDTA